MIYVTSVYGALYKVTKAPNPPEDPPGTVRATWSQNLIPEAVRDAAKKEEYRRSPDAYRVVLGHLMNSILEAFNDTTVLVKETQNPIEPCSWLHKTIVQIRFALTASVTSQQLGTISLNRRLIR